MGPQDKPSQRNIMHDLTSENISPMMDKKTWAEEDPKAMEETSLLFYVFARGFSIGIGAIGSCPPNFCH